MNNIGEKLKNARLEQGLSLADMQAKTKIQEKYLDAIERDELASLPGQFYYNTFVKQYAQALGLDGEALLEGTEAPSSEDILNEHAQAERIRSSRHERPQEESTSDELIHEKNDTAIPVHINHEEADDQPSDQQADIPSRVPDPVNYSQPQELSFDEEGALEGEADDEISTTSVSFDEPLGYGHEPSAETNRGEQTQTPGGTVIEYPADEDADLNKPATAGPVPSRQATNDDNIPSRKDRSTVNEKSKKHSSSCFERYGCFLIIILLILVAAALFYFFINQDSASDTGHLNLDPSSEQVEDSANNESDEADSSDSSEDSTADDAAGQDLPAAEIEQTEADGTNAIYTMNSQEADTIKVEVASTAPEAWVSVSADGELYRQAILGQDEVMEVNLDGSISSIEFAVGNADGTEIRINGTVLEFPAENAGNPTQYLTVAVN